MRTRAAGAGWPGVGRGGQVRFWSRSGGVSLPSEHAPPRTVNPVSRRLGDTRKAKQLLGFETAISLEEGLRDLVAWWREARALETAQKF